MAAIAVGVTLAVGLVALMLKTGEKKIEQTIARLYDAKDDQFGRAMGVLLGPPNIAGNRFEALLNGDEIFPSMLAAIRGAKKTISFESYIYWSGSIGREFAEALSERARAGVKVHRPAGLARQQQARCRASGDDGKGGSRREAIS